MPTYECDDFRVTFTRTVSADSGADLYRVEAEYAGGRTVSSTFRLPMSSTRLEELVVNLARSGLREIAPTDMALVHTDAEQLGSELGTALFDDVIGASYIDAQRVAAAAGRGLRLTLSLGATPELLSVPWELLYRRPRFLASQRHTPIVRFLDVGDVPAALPIDGPVRVLGVVSSPAGLAALDVEDERARVEAALDSMIDRGLVELEWCDPATPRSLRHCLRDGTFHILHFVGHSDFDATGEGALYLSDEDGQPTAVTDAVLTALLGDQTSLRLVVLNSCKGARTTLTDPFSGIATSLVALGLPAVVAMQFSISDDAAIVFAEELFTSLVGRQYPIDAAVSEARKAIFAEVSEIEWATPVLFLRAFDGRLFEFAAEPTAIPLKVAPMTVIAVDEPQVTSASSSADPADAPPLATPPPPPPWQTHSSTRDGPDDAPVGHRRRRFAIVAAVAVVAVGVASLVLLRLRNDDDSATVDARQTNAREDVTPIGTTVTEPASTDAANPTQPATTQPATTTPTSTPTTTPTSTPTCAGSPLPPRPALTGLSPEFDDEFNTVQQWLDLLASAQPGADNTAVVDAMTAVFPTSNVTASGNLDGYVGMEASYLLPVTASTGRDGNTTLDVAALIYDNATRTTPCRTGFLCSNYTVGPNGMILDARSGAAPPMTLDDLYVDNVWLASTDLGPFADRLTVADWFTSACRSAEAS